MNNLIGSRETREQRAAQIDNTLINIKNMLLEAERTIKGGIPLSEEYYHYLSLLPHRIGKEINSNIGAIKLKSDLKIATEEIEKMKADVLNEDESVNSLVSMLFNSIDENNVEGMMFAQNLKALIESGQVIITTSKDDGEACYNSDFDYVSIGKNYIEYGNYTVLAHELGHYFHKQVLDGNIPSNFDEIVSQAKLLATENGTLQEVSQVYKGIISKANEQAQNDVNMTLQEKAQEFISLQKYFIQSGIKPIAAIKMAKEQIYASRISANYDRTINSGQELEYTPELADIIDAVHAGKKQDNNGKFFALTRGHGSKYFSTRENQFSEMIADFTALKITGKQHDLELLRTMFGNEFYNMLDTTFSHFIQTNLVQEENKNQDEVQEFIEVTTPQYSPQTQKLIEQSKAIIDQSMLYPEEIATNSLSSGRVRH